MLIYYYHLLSLDPRACFHLNLYSPSHTAKAAAHAVRANHLAFSPDPPSYAAIASSPPEDTHSKVFNARHAQIPTLMGVNARWHIPLLICRALSTAPAAWWGLRCAFTFLGELLRRDGVGTMVDPWTVEKRFRVTEVFLAILWVGPTPKNPSLCKASLRQSDKSALRADSSTFVVFRCGLPFLFLHRLPHVKMVRQDQSLQPGPSNRDLSTCRLLFYTPSATFVRLLTTNFLIAYIASYVLYLSGASEDPRMLLPAWVSIATVC